jgi:hypothetical protein
VSIAPAPCNDDVGGRSSGPLASRRIPFTDIPRPTWDRLLAATARATPFSSWTFHRAWWDAYGEAAHEEYMVCYPVASASALGSAIDGDDVVAIVPLMHRHEVEPGDALLHTVLRPAAREPGTPVVGFAKAVFFGASYHADYATVLCDPLDLPAVAERVASCLAAGPDLSHGDRDWDVIDLRRLRHDDPALPALESALRGAARRHGWTVIRELEDVCPVVRLPMGGWEEYLATLDGHDRHEIRRKMRRAEAAGRLRFDEIDDPRGVVEALIELHQARWGHQGLFPDTEGGARSKRFLRRLAELEEAGGALRLGRLTLDDRTIFAAISFHEGPRVYYYNAGTDPAVKALSPGVVGTAAHLRASLAKGCRTFDFLRGNEPYKYTWGAIDEPIFRLLVTRNQP